MDSSRVGDVSLDASFSFMAHPKLALVFSDQSAVDTHVPAKSARDRMHTSTPFAADPPQLPNFFAAASLHALQTVTLVAKHPLHSGKSAKLRAITNGFIAV